MRILEKDAFLKKRIGVIGAGILGLAVAKRLQESYPAAAVVLFEKEGEPGRHQSTHNSGVLHCGLHYEPGSLKARLAVEGMRTMAGFCRQYDVPFELCGKVVVASDEREHRFLEELARRGAANGIEGLRYLDASALKQREPHVRAFSSLLVPAEGIVDYKSVIDRLVLLVSQRQGMLLLNNHVRSVAERKGGQLIVETSQQEMELDFLVSCAGLHADRMYRAGTGRRSILSIVPFRGEYFLLKQGAEELVNHLVYPVPDPAFPFLGVHFTRLVRGGREVGPNAVLAFKREGYSFTDFSLRDTFEVLGNRELRRFIVKNLPFVAGEISSSLSKSAFLAKGQKMVPELRADHLTRGTAGVRAQAIGADGMLVMDFMIQRHGNQVHVLNAPSPGATAALALADYIVNEYVY